MSGRGMRTLALGTAILTACCIVTTACGVGSTDSVEQISPVELERITPRTTIAASISSAPATDVGVSTPESSMPEASTTTTTMVETTTTAPPVPFEAYFIEGSELVALDVDVPAASSLRQRLDALESGPSPEQLENGIRTALPDGLIKGVLRADARITVKLDDAAFAAIEPSDQLLIIGQIVLTLTGEPGFQDVSFESAGAPMRVPRPNNIVSDPGEPVTRGDYESMLARP